MTEELQRRVRLIHDLERAIRFWELLRDGAQRVVNEQGDSIEPNLRTIEARAYIARCNSSIRALAARIDELEMVD
jgi:hypothetical protein